MSGDRPGSIEDLLVGGALGPSLGTSVGDLVQLSKTRRRRRWRVLIVSTSLEAGEARSSLLDVSLDIM